MAWMLFSLTRMSQTVISNDHHFKVQYYTAALVQMDFIQRLLLSPLLWPCLI